jgi:hypothetical protein
MHVINYMHVNPGPFAGECSKDPGPLEQDISEKLASGVAKLHFLWQNLQGYKLH